MNAVDTNVFVYAADDYEPNKQAKAAQLLDQLVQTPTQTCLLWQVAGEFLSCMRRWESQSRILRTDVEANIRDVLAMFPLVLPSQNVIDLSLDLSFRFSLSHWDSMLLAACFEAGVDSLYSEDLDAGTSYNGVTVINPFA